MKGNTLLLALLFAGVTAAWANEDSTTISSITQKALLEGKAYDNLKMLCKDIGPRLSGSANEVKTQSWAVKALKEAGADTVWLQPVKVPKWTRGEEQLKVKKGNKWIDVPMLSLGNSEGTKGSLLEAGIVVFETIDALKNATEESLKGKIAFLNAPFPEHFPCTFDGYGEVGGNRYNGPAIAAKKGAAGFIIRSLSTGVGAYDLPHTGVMSYGDAPNKIPAIAIGNAAADSLQTWSKEKEVKIRLQSNCKMEGEVLSYNIIGELKGKENSFITVGAHYDSWDVGEGAHDDGAGCVQSIEVLRLFKVLNIKPKHTLRVVLFANEENGSNGGKTYADSAIAKNEKHVFALESDAGGFSPRGFGLVGADAALRQSIEKFKHLLLPLGIYDFSKEEGGVDIGPLNRKMGVTISGLLPDTQRYFDIHHCAKDTFESVNKRELHLGAAAMAGFLYLLDKNLK
jgi:carboxypeptidase Q